MSHEVRLDHRDLPVDLVHQLGFVRPQDGSASALADRVLVELEALECSILLAHVADHHRAALRDVVVRQVQRGQRSVAVELQRRPERHRSSVPDVVPGKVERLQALAVLQRLGDPRDRGAEAVLRSEPERPTICYESARTDTKKPTDLRDLWEIVGLLPVGLDADELVPAEHELPDNLAIAAALPR